MRTQDNSELLPNIVAGSRLYVTGTVLEDCAMEQLQVQRILHDAIKGSTMPKKQQAWKAIHITTTSIGRGELRRLRQFESKTFQKRTDVAVVYGICSAEFGLPRR